MDQGKGRKIVVGMSGGVDSSISLILLKKNGWNPIGVSLKFGTWEDSCNSARENSCCTAKSIKTAQRICKEYSCEHVTLEVGENFHEKVISYFTESLKSAKTPNPCIICNRYLKFLELFDYAKNNDIQYIATGHYAKIIKSKKYGCYFISKPKDKKKDQTYYLALLPQEWLPHIIFPLADLTKEKVYKMAEEEGLDFYLKLAQSQDFCFVSEKSLQSFIEKEVGTKDGPIKDKTGKVLGKHSGLASYTIGQRKNIGLSGGPYFVVEKDVESNVLIVSTKKSDILKKEAILENCVFSNILFSGIAQEVKAKIRYQHKPAVAMLKPYGKSQYVLTFGKPQLAVTPGQYAVFYLKNLVIGAGEIKGSL
jgi:tRNA-specific 2-thiouridylase